MSDLLNTIHRYRYDAAKAAKAAKLRGDADRHAEYLALCRELNCAEGMVEFGHVGDPQVAIDKARRLLGNY